MRYFFKKIDDFINHMSADLKDLIQKAAIAVGAILALAGVLSAIIQGIQDAKPAGFQIAEESNDLFYLDQIREETSKRLKLIEDVEFDIESLTGNRLKNENFHRSISRDTIDHLRGESDDLISPKNELRNQRHVPGLINNNDEENNPALKRPNNQRMMTHDKMSTDPIFDLSLQKKESETLQNNQYNKPNFSEKKRIKKKEKKIDLDFLE